MFVTAAAYPAPRLGVASMLMIAIASQLARAVLIDHFGLFGVRADPISASRIVGLVLVVAGATWSVVSASARREAHSSWPG